MHKRGLCRRACGVCLSVCQSSSCILSKRVNIGRIFNYAILVFHNKRGDNIPTGNPVTGGVECIQNTVNIWSATTTLKMFNVIEGHLIDMISLNDANYAFYIHQMNRVNSMALPWWQHHKHCHSFVGLTHRIENVKGWISRSQMAIITVGGELIMDGCVEIECFDDACTT